MTRHASIHFRTEQGYRTLMYCERDVKKNYRVNRFGLTIDEDKRAKVVTTPSSVVHVLRNVEIFSNLLGVLVCVEKHTSGMASGTFITN